MSGITIGLIPFNANGAQRYYGGYGYVGDSRFYNKHVSVTNMRIMLDVILMVMDMLTLLGFIVFEFPSLKCECRSLL